MHYRLRDKITYTNDDEATASRKKLPFIFGRILAGNRIFCQSINEDKDLVEKHWENCRFIQDLGGLQSYPPYPEASGYMMNREVVKFLVQEDIPFRGAEWAVEDASHGAILAGTRTRLIHFPFEVIRAQKNLRAGR